MPKRARGARFTAIYGPNIESSNGAGTNTPSAVVVALFAFLATWVIAKYAYGRKAESGK